MMDQPEEPPQAVLFTGQFYYCYCKALVKPVSETIFDHTLKSLTKASQIRPSSFSLLGYRPPMQEHLYTTIEFPVNEELAIMNRYVVG